MNYGRSRAKTASLYDGLPTYKKLLFWTVVFAPLQAAFTVSLGFPLKVSEVLLICAMAAFPFAKKSVPHSFIERHIVLALGATVFATSCFHLLQAAPGGEYPGFTRSPEVDAALYLAYGGMIIVLWLLAVGLDPELMKQALLFSVWVAFVAVVIQFVLFTMNQVDLLELLNFETKVRSAALDGSEGGAMRSGPFTEGQHLGFFSGGAVILAWRSRARWTMLAAGICLVYSQSTTGIAGLAIAIAVMAAIKPGRKTLGRLFLVLLGAVSAVMVVPELRSLIQLQFAKLGLFGYDSIIYGAGQSLDVRTVKSEIAVQMMMDNPLLGVGPGRFGFWFYTYPRASDVPEYYFNGVNRAIAENVYLHIGSEFGVLALILFALFVVTLLAKLRRGEPLDFALAMFVAVSITTQSSWTFIPIWVFFAYLTARSWKLNDNQNVIVPIANSNRVIPPGYRSGKWAGIQ